MGLLLGLNSCRISTELCGCSWLHNEWCNRSLARSGLLLPQCFGLGGFWFSHVLETRGMLRRPHWLNIPITHRLKRETSVLRSPEYKLYLISPHLQSYFKSSMDPISLSTPGFLEDFWVCHYSWITLPAFISTVQGTLPPCLSSLNISYFLTSFC